MCSCDALMVGILSEVVIPCISQSRVKSQRQFLPSNDPAPSFQLQRDSHQATSLNPSQRFTTTQQPFPNTGGDSNDICTATPFSDLCKAPFHQGSTACEVCDPSSRRMFPIMAPRELFEGTWPTRERPPEPIMQNKRIKRLLPL